MGPIYSTLYTVLHWPLFLHHPFVLFSFFRSKVSSLTNPAHLLNKFQFYPLHINICPITPRSEKRLTHSYYNSNSHDKHKAILCWVLIISNPSHLLNKFRFYPIHINICPTTLRSEKDSTHSSYNSNTHDDIKLYHEHVCSHAWCMHDACTHDRYWLIHGHTVRMAGGIVVTKSMAAFGWEPMLWERFLSLGR